MLPIRKLLLIFWLYTSKSHKFDIFIERSLKKNYYTIKINDQPVIQNLKLEEEKYKTSWKKGLYICSRLTAKLDTAK